jgi:C4-dicarboxylate-specific signal transduction histidine kinase
MDSIKDNIKNDCLNKINKYSLYDKEYNKLKKKYLNFLLTNHPDKLNEEDENKKIEIINDIKELNNCMDIMKEEQQEREQQEKEQQEYLKRQQEYLKRKQEYLRKQKEKEQQEILKKQQEREQQKKEQQKKQLNIFSQENLNYIIK